MAARIKSLLEQYKNLELVQYESNETIDPTCEKDNVVLINDHWSERDLLTIAADCKIQSLLNSLRPNFYDELSAALNVHSHPYEFHMNPISFLYKGIPNSLFLLFNKKEDKANLIKMLDAFIGQVQLKGMATNVKVVFEELFMNALYDAPAEAKKLNIKSKKQHSEFSFACDSTKFMISCFDPYGSMNIKKFLKRMRDVHIQGAHEVMNMNQSRGGAGIGCSLLFRYSSTMIVTVEPGKGTRVTCLFPYKMSQRQFLSLGKNLQAFLITPTGEDHG